MRIVLKRSRGGPPSLSCIRDDGSRTWSRLHPFFPLHDLTHFAVESVLQLDEAFFGLVAAGWALDDFAAPGAAGRLPADAVLAEHLVGMFDQERGSGMTWTWTAPAMRDALTAALGPSVRILTADELNAIRQLRDHLCERWRGVAAGDSMELEFPATAAEPAARRP